MTYSDLLKYIDKKSVATPMAFERNVLLKRAIEKQMPKKPAPKTSKGYEVPVCGKCNGIMDLIQGELNYCPNCGQKIDWNDTE